MELNEMTQDDVIEQAKKTLKQFKPNVYLAGIDTNPVLTEEGTIENLDVFIEIVDDTFNPISCDTPMEKLAANAPRLVLAILKAIDQMDATSDEKRLLFGVYIEGKKFEGNQEPFNQAYVAFSKAYNQ